MVKKRISILKGLLMYLMMVCGIVLLIFLVANGTVYLQGPSEMFLVADGIAYVQGPSEFNKILHSTDLNQSQDEIVRDFIAWESNPHNFKSVYGNSILNKILDFYLRDLNPSNEKIWFISYWKMGACGEKAILLSELCKAAGIPSRIVRTKGEDHDWVEVYINGSWVQADGNGVAYFNNPRIYEQRWGENGHFSYVYAKAENGTTIRRTHIYSDVGNLTIFVHHNGTPIEGATVFLISKPKGRLAVWDVTDENGLCEMKLGGKRYKIEVYAPINLFYAYYGKTDFEVVENRSQSVSIEVPKEIDFLRLPSKKKELRYSKIRG